MANWIKKPCLDLLKKINDVPLDDHRESRQLTILMAGIANMNKEMMRRAAESARAQLGDLTQQDQLIQQDPKPAAKATRTPASEPQESVKEALDDTPDLDDFDSFDEELDMIEQTLIRSIGD
jgi:hypothetical protein